MVPDIAGRTAAVRVAGRRLGKVFVTAMTLIVVHKVRPATATGMSIHIDGGAYPALV
jgi:hypothetical protein